MPKENAPKTDQVVDPNKIDESAASATLGPGHQGTGGEKMQVLAKLAGIVSVMNNTDAVEFFNKMIAGIGQEAQNIPAGAAAHNAASIAMKGAIKEGVADMFEGEDLPAELKDKTAVLFEAAVEARVAIERTAIQEELQVKYEGDVEKLAEDTMQRIDTFLDFAATKWLEENEVAVDSNLRTELVDTFLTGLKNLFTEHYISVPEEKVDVIEQLMADNQKLNDQLAELLEERAELEVVKEESARKDVLAKISEGLSLSQAEKLKTLAESVDFDGDAEAYTKKLELIKEHYFKKSPEKTDTNTVLSETFEGPADLKENEITDPSMRAYASVISTMAGRG